MSFNNLSVAPGVYKLVSTGSRDNDSESNTAIVLKYSSRGSIVHFFCQLVSVSELVEHSARHLCEGVVFDLGSGFVNGFVRCLMNVLLEAGGLCLAEVELDASDIIINFLDLGAEVIVIELQLINGFGVSDMLLAENQRQSEGGCDSDVRFHF